MTDEEARLELNIPPPRTRACAGCKSGRTGLVSAYCRAEAGPFFLLGMGLLGAGGAVADKRRQKLLCGKTAQICQNVALFYFYCIKYQIYILYNCKDSICLWCYTVSSRNRRGWIMEYLSRLASMALKSKGSKIFTIQDGHEMTITPAGDGKTMNINIDDGASYKTKGVGNFIEKIERILKARSVTGWDEARQGQDSPDQVLSMYNDDDGTSGNGTTIDSSLLS